MVAITLSRSSWNDNLDFDNFGQYRGLYIGHREFLGDKGLLGRRPIREMRPRGSEEEEAKGASVELLWEWTAPVTAGRSVTCMAWNVANEDVLAVGEVVAVLTRPRPRDPLPSAACAVLPVRPDRTHRCWPKSAAEARA